MISIEDAYLHVPFHPSYHHYLQFADNGQRYQFNVLLFSIAIAHQVIRFAHQNLVKLHSCNDNFLSPDQAKYNLPHPTTRALGISQYESSVNVIPIQSEIWWNGGRTRLCLLSSFRLCSCEYPLRSFGIQRSLGSRNSWWCQTPFRANSSLKQLCLDWQWQDCTRLLGSLLIGCC